MDTIGSVGNERRPPFREAQPPAAPSDRNRDHGGSHDSDHDGRRGNDAPDLGTAPTPTPSAASTQRKLNVTA